MSGRGKRKRRLTLACGLPEDALGGARVTLFDQNCVMIEGQQGMVELDTKCMRLRTRRGVLSVLGEALTLKELSADAAMITGEPIVVVTYGKVSGD